MVTDEPDKEISIVATQLLRELDDWTVITEDGRVEIFSGHRYNLCQLINRLLYRCYLKYEETRSPHLRDVLQLIVSDALGADFGQWLRVNSQVRKQETFMELPVDLEDSRNANGIRALRKALGMLLEKPIKTEQKNGGQSKREPLSKNAQIVDTLKDLPQIANIVHKLVQEESNKRWFQKHIVAFRKAKNTFSQALKEAQKAAKANPKLRYDYDEDRDKDKDAPKPPQKDYEVELQHVLDDYPKAFWRPKLPFNPDGWLSRFQCQWAGLVHPPAEEPRNRAQMLMCEYALLAAIHDEALDIPACDRLTDRDQDDWVESLWENVNHEGVTMDDRRTYEDRMRNINTAFNDVEADLASKQKNGGQSEKWHNEDFTEVVWNSKQYKFDKPQQALSVKYLWENKRGREKSIGEAIGSEADNFRLIHIFRQKGKKQEMHPAWGTMIIPDGKGIFTLAECKKAPKK